MLRQKRSGVDGDADGAAAGHLDRLVTHMSAANCGFTSAALPRFHGKSGRPRGITGRAKFGTCLAQAGEDRCGGGLVWPFATGAIRGWGADSAGGWGQGAKR